MHYGQIYNCDTANGPGFRVSLFVSGCTHHCPGCFNKDTWNFNFGNLFTEETIEEILGMLRQSYIQGLSLLGGEPMEPSNQRALLPLVRRVKEEMPEKDIWVYSGYLFDELMGIKPEDPADAPKKRYGCRCDITDELLRHCDVLVDGEFFASMKDVTLKFRGSRNQRILDLKASMKEFYPIWVEKYR